MNKSQNSLGLTAIFTIIFSMVLKPGRLIYKLMNWLGNHYYLGIAVFMHLVLVSALFLIVIQRDEIEEEYSVMQISVDVSLLKFEGEKNDKEKAGGKTAFPDLTKFHPGNKKEKTAKRDKAKSMQSPKTSQNKNVGTEGTPTFSPNQSNSLDNLLNGTGATSGNDASGGGDIPAGYGMRDGGNKGLGIARYGGGKNTEDAVELGLAWLNNHLHLSSYVDKEDNEIPIGWWDPTNFQKDARNVGVNPDTSNTGDNATSRMKDYQLGVTSLALLAFLGAGNTTSQGKYYDTVSRVLKYIVQQQDKKTGQFKGRNNYNHIMATEAIAEAFILSKDDFLKKPLQKAVDYLISIQHQAGGWDYVYVKNPKYQRNDSSITSLALIALKSADYAGIEIPRNVYLKIIYHFQRLIDTDGYLYYGDRKKLEDVRKGAAMLGTSIFCRLLLGEDKESPTIKRQINLLVNQHLPDAVKIDTLDHSYYAWYWGTLASFFYGGESWSRWNAASKPALLPLQETAGHRKGSFKTIDMWSWAGGRIYSTAINVLTLEIYYRYIPAFFLQDSKDLQPYWQDNEKLLTALEDGDKLKILPKPHR